MSDVRSLIVHEMREHVSTVRRMRDISSTVTQRITGLDIQTPKWCETSSIVIAQDSRQAFDSLPTLANVQTKDLLGIIVSHSDRLKAEEGVTINEEVKVKMLTRMETVMNEILVIGNRSYQEISNSLFRGICHVNVSQSSVDEIVVNKLVDAAFGAFMKEDVTPPPANPREDPSESDSFPWPLIGLVVGGAVLLLGIFGGFLLLMHRRSS